MSRHIPTRVISLTIDEINLLVDAIDFWCDRLNNETAYSEAHKAAGRNVFKRAKELRLRLDQLRGVKVPA